MNGGYISYGSYYESHDLGHKSILLGGGRLRLGVEKTDVSRGPIRLTLSITVPRLCQLPSSVAWLSVTVCRLGLSGIIVIPETD